MSESIKINTAPEGLDADSLSQDTYNNGAKHVYAVKDGKKKHISHDDVLEAYGYDPADSAENWSKRSGTAEDPGTVDEDPGVTTPGATGTGELRPVEDGEYGDDYLSRPENSDPDHEDYLPVGVMAHEPHTFADAPEGSRTPEDPQPPRTPEDPEPPRTPEVPEPPRELGPGEDGPLPVQTPEVDKALIERLDAARSRYAELTAKSRKSYLGRFFKPDTQVGGILAKIPLMKSIVSGWNSFKASKPVQGAAERLSSLRKFNPETEAAKQAYEEAYTEVAKATAAELERVGWEEDVVRSLSLIGNIKQDQMLEDEIAFQRQDQSKSANRFVNWWVSQKGLKGKLKKAGVVIAAGAVTGLTGGLFAGATGAWIAGGAAGFGIGKHVTGRRANGIDSDGWTVAARQAAEDRHIKESRIRAEHGMDADGNPIAEEWGKDSLSSIIDRTEARTDEEMMGNRKRVRTATALGAAAGKGVFKIKEALTPEKAAEKPHYRNPGHDRPDPGLDHTPDTTPEAPAAQPIPEIPTHVDTSGFKYPWNWAEAQFGQGKGGSMLHELGAKAQASGHNVQWHRAGVREWIEVDGASDTDTVVNILSQYR